MRAKGLTVVIQRAVRVEDTESVSVQAKHQGTRKKKAVDSQGFPRGKSLAACCDGERCRKKGRCSGYDQKRTAIVRRISANWMTEPGKAG